MRQITILRLLTFGLLAAGWPSAAGAQELSPELQARLDRWYRSARVAARGTWGIAVSDQTGQILWSVSQDQPLIPASTVKLFTTGYARSVLGGEARRQTRVLGYGRLDEATGEWCGSWVLEMNGDPSLEGPFGGGPRLRDLAEQMASSGIRRLRGPLTVMTAEGRPAEATFPTMWRRANWGSLYTPLVGSLTLHENVVRFFLRPGFRVGSPAELVGSAPEGLDGLITVRVKTVRGARTRVRLKPMRDGGFLATGTIGLGSGVREIATVAGDPRVVLTEAWARALSRAGIEWDRTPPTIQVENQPDQVLAAVESPTFDSVASEINRRSVNIGAELLLRWAADREQGLGPDLLMEHVQQVAGVAGGVKLVDGSGMSHEDRVTPATFIYYMANALSTPSGRTLPYLLPANGQGTLARLAGGLPGPGVVRAKTGTLSGVSTLVGYLGRREGMLLVSLMYNGPRSRTAKRHQWKMFRLLGAGGAALPDDLLDPAAPDVESQLGGDPTSD